MEVKIQLSGGDRTVGLALEEFRNASKPSSPLAAPHRETIQQTYLARCDADLCLHSRLNSTQTCVINYSNQGDVSVCVWRFSNALPIGARIPRSMNSTCQPTSLGVEQ